MSEQATENSFGTTAVHAAKHDEYSSMPIYMAATSQHFYTRGGNPSIDALEQGLADLEGGTYAVAAACGMAAITQTLLTLLESGDRVLCHRSVYDWTDTFFREEAPRFGITTAQVDLRDLTAVDKALQTPTKLVYFEPLSNPGLDLIDVPAVVALAHDAGAVVVVDNTFLTPYLFKPLRVGADVVIHTATKYLSGHGDAMGGIAISNDQALMDRIRRGRNIYGGVISPFNAFLIMRGIGSLHVRMPAHCANALQVAEFLHDHPQVADVRYPGLPDDHGHGVATRLLQAGYGGMLGFQIAGDQERAEVFKKALRLCKPWVSLGDIGSLAYVRWPEERKGIPPGFVRMSVGIENCADIIADLEQALDALP